MNLQHLSSHLKLDIKHLYWQAQSQHLTPQQFQQRFNHIVHGYSNMVDPQDRPEVERMIEHYRHQSEKSRH